METFAVGFVLVAVGWIAERVHRAIQVSRELPPERTPLALEPVPVTGRLVRLAHLHDLAPGERIAVIARVAGAPTMRAPMSGRACVAHDFVLTTERTDVPRMRLRLLRAEPFAIEDDTGRAQVDPRGAFVRLRYDDIKSSINRFHMNDHAAIARYEPDDSLTGWEGALVAGAEVLVVGVVKRVEDADDHVFRRSADSRLTIAGGPDAPAMIGNRPADLLAARRSWAPPSVADD